VSVQSATQVTRIFGADRYETAVQIAKQGWTTANTVVIAYGGNFPDALAGTPLAAALNAPMLLTKTDATPANVLQELASLKAKNVILLGSEASISKAQADSLARTYSVTRYAGKTRYDTAAAISQALMAGKGFGVTWKPSATMILATGENYPDALSMGPYAAINLTPIMFSTSAGIPTQTQTFISQNKITSVIAVGASCTPTITNALSRMGVSKVQQLAGADRYATSVAIAKALFNPSTTTVPGVSAAVGTNFPDALTGAVLSAKKGFPILLVNPKTGATADEQAYVRSIAKPPQFRITLYVYGSTAALSNAMVATLA